MKSEHRHDLQTNDLGKLMVQAEPYVEKYGVKAVVAAGVIFVLVLGYLTWSSSRTGQAAEGWTRLAACTSTEDFENVADEFSGTEVGQWASVHAAESHLQSGIRSSFTDRSAGDRALKDAKEQFQKLLDSSSTLPEIRERALFGMACTEESVSDGDLKNAITLYQKLIQEYPDSVFRKLAEKRVKPVEGEKVAVLDQEETKNFYKWFHAQNPKPGDRQRPGFNLPMPGLSPDGESEGSNETPGLPELPGLPSLPEPVKSSPGTDDKKTEDKKPAEQKTDDAKPAAPEKADSKPAEKPAAPAGSDKKAETPAEKPKSETATEKKP